MNISKLSPILPLSVYNQIPSVIEVFKINNSLRLSHFLAQVAHESGNFNFKIENLNYSSDGLLKIFPKYFTKETALVYQRNPEKIANRVYANRMGNGDESSGNGFAFRGRGYIQLTGKNNYIEFDKFVPENILEVPNLVCDKYPLLSAAWYWDSRKLNAIADKGATEDVIKEVTKKVNGGLIGIEDRVKKFNEYYKMLLS